MVAIRSDYATEIPFILIIIRPAILILIRPAE